MKIHLNLKTYSPSRACEGTDSSLVWAREGGRGGCTRPEQTGRRDQGVGTAKLSYPAGETWLSLWESWQRAALTERAALRGVHKGGDEGLPPLE